MNSPEELMAMEHMVVQNRDIIFNLTEKCMDRCVNSFHGKTLNGAEKACLEKCVDKNVKFLQRVKMRFEEQTISQMQGAAGGAPTPQ